MYKKTIKFTDYDGNNREESFYFNLNEAELTKWNNSKSGGLTKLINRLSEKQDAAGITKLFSEIIDMSYGEKSDDGRRFIKNREVLDNFKQTEAYSTLFMELSSNADAGLNFIKSILPVKMQKEIAKMEELESSNANITVAGN